MRITLISAGVLALASSAGCQPDSTTTSSAGSAGSDAGSAGTGGSNAGSAGSNTGGSTGGSSAGSAGSNTGGSTGGSSAGSAGTAGTGGSSVDPCLDQATDATIYDVTKGVVGPMVKVKIDGVIAMSKKILVSHSKGTGNCLWGVFISAPKTEGGQQLTETAANSGLMLLSNGNPIDISMPCANDTDAIPKDVAPGDVLDVVATSDSFLPDFVPNNPCGTKMTDSDIPTLQLSKACKATKTGTAAVPAPHAFTPDQLAPLAAQHKADPGAEMFHHQWGGVKIKVTGKWSPDLWPQMGGAPSTVTGPYGIIRIAPSDAEIHDKLYYVNGSMDVCSTGPKFADNTVMFDYVQGFHYLDYCTWSIANLDKCADFSPQSDDCKAMNIMSCP